LALLARLKSCPFKTAIADDLWSEFFRNLQSLAGFTGLSLS